MKRFFVTNLILAVIAVTAGFFSYRLVFLYRESQNRLRESSQISAEINYRLEREIKKLGGIIDVQRRLSTEQQKVIQLQGQFTAVQAGKISGLENDLGGAKTEIDKLKKIGGEPLPKDFINSMLQATARIRCLIVKGPRSETVSAGSGSVLGRYEAVGGEYVVMTNAHVVKPREGMSDYDCDVIFGAGYRYDATVVRSVIGSGFDFAFLKLGDFINEPTDIVSYSELGIGFCEFSDVAVGDSMTVLSYPGFVGPERAVSAGEVTQILDGPIYEASALIDLGSSGGVAILNKKRCVLGMPTWKGVGDKLGLGYIQSWPMMLEFK